ncbi:anhydro-N-acetylmuramic acid kinase [Kushneria indalinina]|uniref:Anhydro-N-acetylmuramic acid kinase n=1 Tax=Kushneria indalinina DSM 14324 TaxID=1122140 RepID=A0A3D9DS28_9GAMM|nr:anhydro-N-acetylmuramic acid kinase [Kushneria indalinina]REC93481.1 anhydro-N-acetylmuramic acid kinase [Kushneria indalinina DSM 14324]
MSLVIGLMSGTSLDGIDAALVKCDHHHRPVLLEATGIEMPEPLRRQLWQLCHAREAAFETLADAEESFCQLQAQAVTALLDKSGHKARDIEAIGSHGQTIEHHPNGPAPYTWQLDNPSRLAELTGCRVVGDFRRRDLAAGGQGAPLAPAFHDALFRDARQWRVLLNLGGFANVTLLPPEGSEIPVIGFDTGPANALLDGWYARHHEGRFDHDGTWAAQGHCQSTLLTRLMSDPFFESAPPKSTGREHFHLQWLEAHLEDESPTDVQATLLTLTVESIARELERHLSTDAQANTCVIPCGGGAHNSAMMNALIARLSPIGVEHCEALGWSPDWLEAGAFAWLAWRRLEGLPGNLASVTGAAGPRVLGGVYER